MSARAEIKAKYARAYRAAGKGEKSRLLDEVVAVTAGGPRHASAASWT